MIEAKLNITLDNELLLPMKRAIEESIDRMLKVVANTNKGTEITLKIELEKETNSSLSKSVLAPVYSPRINYTIKEKVKEQKYKQDKTLGHEFKISETEDGFVVEKAVEQESLFEEEEK